MDYKKIAMEKHAEWAGKIEVVSRAKVENVDDLSIAYTPGVAEPCLAIKENPELSYTLTRRHNMVAVITDGSAVLGLGNIGPVAGMPVMEGKCVLFKEFPKSVGTPSITTNGSQLLMEPRPRILIDTLSPGFPASTTCTPEMRP